MHVNKISNAAVALSGSTIYCYKRSFNNAPKKFYYHREVKLNKHHIYTINQYEMLYCDVSGDLMVAYDMTPTDRLMIRDMLQSGGTMTEAIDMVML